LRNTILQFLLFPGTDRSISSGAAGILTIYSISSLILYNRRQRALWVDRELERLIEAKKAYMAGDPTPEQLAILENEKIGDEEHRRKEDLRRQNFWYKGQEWLLGGMKKDEAAECSAAASAGAGNKKPGVLEAVNAKRLESENILEKTIPQGGPLDQLGENVETAATESKRSWTSWVTGR
jgi:hypothetical protein